MIPFTVVDKAFVLLVLLMEFTAGADAATPFTVDVMVLAVLLIVLVVTAGAAFAGAQLFPFQERTWPVEAPVVVPNGDPFIFETTDVPRLPVTSPAKLAVKPEVAMPFTVLINWLVPFCVSVFELMILTGVEEIPFTVVDKAFILLVLLIEFTAGADTETPFTIEVIVLAELLNVCVVFAGAAFDGAQLFPFQERTWPIEAPIVVPNGDPFIFETTDVPRLPVTSPATLAVKAEVAMPLTVLIS